MKRPRGFLLVFGLLVLILLFTLGLGFLGKQVDTYRAAEQAANSTLAYECAWAGLEEARVKIMKDRNFPPVGDEEQLVFAYSEVLMDLAETTPVGSYRVLVDSRWLEPPFEILRLEVVGSAGDPTDPATARRKLSVEVDMAENNRSGPGANPNLGRFMNFQDYGGL